MITENQLDEWVRGNSRIAQEVIVELVWRLVAASAPNPRERRFPLGDSIGQPGPDGVLAVDVSSEPFVPAGRSYWEIGTGLDAHRKATEDYQELTEVTPKTIRKDSTFIFVTPLSARRDWGYTWKQKAQARWVEERKHRNEWKDVRVIDGTKLVDWIRLFPAVERWLAHKMGFPLHGIDTPTVRWEILQGIGSPQLTPQVFLTNREDACKKLGQILAREINLLRLQTHFPDQIVDFVSAFLATLDDETRVDVAGRCLIISSIEAWNAICEYYKDHILIAAPALDLTGSDSSILIAKALRAGHSVIHGSLPGGIPGKNSDFVAPFPRPKVYQLSEALEKAGYPAERAWFLAQKSGGDLSTLLKLLQNIPLMPTWAQGSEASDLAIALLSGAWNEKQEADCKIVADLSGKPYGEWIQKIRELALRPGTPLTHRDGKWKFTARYEGWYALGPRIYDDRLDRFRRVSVDVLREKNPAFDLPPKERFVSQAHGKGFTYSQALREGLAESLALLGSHPKALISSSFGKAEGTAILAVREILSDADWILWASLNKLLPLLAEAAPDEFLNAIERALRKTPCPFDELFAQESSGITGANYMTGLLWALETLAWHPDYLTSVVSILGGLAERDPGGNWANRPAESLRNVFLPWHPQTCAPIAKRFVAMRTLIRDHPAVGWEVLLALLPEIHQVSFPTRRPTWREEAIPEDCSRQVTADGYWEQVKGYATMAIEAAESDVIKLTELIKRLPDLPFPALDQLLAHLESDSVLTLAEADRLPLWNALRDLVTQHRKFASAGGAMNPEQVDRIEGIAERLAPKSPALFYQRLFGNRAFDLFEENGNYEQQTARLEERRRRAIQEITEAGGLQAVVDYALSVESPWHVGFSFGFVANSDTDSAILPGRLDTEQEQLIQFVKGFVRGRFRSKGWEWVDKIDTTNWSRGQIGEFLSCLPFDRQTWKHSYRLLGRDESPYWTRAIANPYEAQTGLELAVDKLLEYGRPFAAIGCLYKTLMDGQPLDGTRSVAALLAAADSSKDGNTMDMFRILEIIRALQNDPNVSEKDLFRVEWAYLPILGRSHQGTSPKLLEFRLANEPDFFCEVVRLAFCLEGEDHQCHELAKKERNKAEKAFHLLWNWKTPPGTLKDGSYDGEMLKAWLHNVKRRCSKTEHLGIALRRVGHVLAYAPPDPDGLWIHQSAAGVLNAEDADDMRVGFRDELLYQRGVHWVDPTGKPEKSLAVRYRKQAEEIEAAGYHRIAGLLRGLAEEYDREAERISSCYPLDE